MLERMDKFTFQKKTSIQDSMKIIRYLESIEDDGIYDIEIKKHRQKRSRNANAYCWVLCEKLAQKLTEMDKIGVYRQAIKEVGVFRQVEINKDAAKTLKAIWEGTGIGWITETVDESRTEGFQIMNLYYGSSTYNTKQMSRLLDNLVQDCKACGIETLPSDELERMMGEWESA